MRKNLIKQLQTQLPRGVPFDTESAKRIGISTALLWKYTKSGWLTSLARGVFIFTNDELRRDACLVFLSKRIKGLHVGGKTALAWRGVRHNLAERERLVLWGDVSAKLPVWFTSRFSSQYSAKHLFSKSTPLDFGLDPLPETREGPLVSEPERALLEMLADVGLGQGVEEARNIMESVRSLRPEALAFLLQRCLRIKVTRLCVQWAEELKLDWAASARAAAKRKLGKSRWSNRLKDGTTLILKA